MPLDELVTVMKLMIGRKGWRNYLLETVQILLVFDDRGVVGVRCFLLVYGECQVF